MEVARMNANHACAACDDVPLILDLVQVMIRICVKLLGSSWSTRGRIAVASKVVILVGFFFF